jgi:AraC-like DNA-binding protein
LSSGKFLHSNPGQIQNRVVVEAAMRGAGLTEAAHHAGFADSARLSRAFRAIFGLHPLCLFKSDQANALRNRRERLSKALTASPLYTDPSSQEFPS